MREDTVANDKRTSDAATALYVVESHTTKYTVSILCAHVLSFSKQAALFLLGVGWQIQVQVHSSERAVAATAHRAQGKAGEGERGEEERGGAGEEGGEEGKK